MTRTVRAFLPVVGDPDGLAAAFIGDPQRWLPGARRDGPDTFVFVVPARQVARSVTASVGAPWRHGETRWRSISWEPVSEDGNPSALDRFLPSLDGELGLHITAGGQVTLLLDGRYDPPGGPVGVAADAIALGRVARGTIEAVLGDIAARLGAEAMLAAPTTTADHPGAREPVESAGR